MKTPKYLHNSLSISLLININKTSAYNSDVAIRFFQRVKTMLLLIYSFSCLSYGNDSISIERIIDYADQLEATNRDSALLFYNEALANSIEIDNPKLIARSYMNLGYYMLNEGKLDSCVMLFNLAKPLYHSVPDTIGLIKIYYAISRYHSLNGDYRSSIENNYEALRYANAINDVEREIFILESIGVSLARYKDYQEAIKIYYEALHKAETIEDTYSVASIKYNISEPYFEMDSMKSARRYLNDAAELSYKHEYMHVYGNSVGSLADYYFKQGEIESAKMYMEKLNDVNKDYYFNDLKMRSELLNSNYHLLTSDFEASVFHGKQALALLSNFQVSNYRLKIYKIISSAYKGSHQYDKAMDFLEKYNSLKDSIVFNERHTELKKIQVQYETVQKDNEIIEKQLIIQNQTKTRQFMFGGMSMLGMLALSIFILLNQRLKKNKIITQRENDLQSQQIAQLQKEKQILSLSSMIEGQESERKRIAQDLHDGLGGLLATIKAKFGFIQNEIAELNSMSVYQQTSTMIDDACSEVRKIAHNMMPDSLTKLGLIEAVKDIATNNTAIKIQVINLGLHPFTETQAIMLYRVIQEFINNTRKHADASEIIIQFSVDDDQTVLYLEDNGKGFDSKDNTQKKSLGLKSMESRVNFLGGDYKMESSLGIGTTLQIKIPK